MCGITGFYSFNSVMDATDYYASHLLLKHRGPDDEGFVAENAGEMIALKGDDTISHYSGLKHINSIRSSRVVLGHRRLSIIDLSYHGHQPMKDETSNYHIVYNGEIYNYIELREELKQLGYSFDTISDTEVVLKAYIEWGQNAFNRFNGMWALAIYNKNDHSLILSRDRFGIKPLYYSIVDGVLYFASEMKFILSYSKKKYSVNIESAVNYLDLCHLNSSENTFWDGILELEPAHCAEFKDGKTIVNKYWKYQPKTKQYSDNQALEEFADIFEDSLSLRMRSDVEVGTLLSGGLDSNMIVCMLNKIGLIKGNEFKSFSAVYDDPHFSERSYIYETLKKINLVPFFVKPGPVNLKTDLNSLFVYMEEPFRSLSPYSQYLLYKTVKEQSNVKVLLNGQGADELFAGYSADYNTLFAAYLSRMKFGKLFGEFSLYSKKRKKGMGSLTTKGFLMETLKALIDPQYFNNKKFRELTFRSLREYLRYDDRNSMAFSVEARVPFLDYRMVEFAFSLDESFKIRNFENKWIERQAAKNIVPKKIVNREDKMGFVTPQEIWQKNELKSEFDRVFRQMQQDGLMTGIDADKICLEYKDYCDGKFHDWAYIWRAYSLYKWKEMANVNG